MTEQQYRVIADRDKGDDPTTDEIFEGYRYTMQANRGPVFTDQVVRIERPVPTTDVDQRKGVSTDRLRDMADLLDGLLNRATLRQAADELDRLRASSPHPPTREQIAEAERLVTQLESNADAHHEGQGTERRRAAAMILTLIQNGADRG